VRRVSLGTDFYRIALGALGSCRDVAFSHASQERRCQAIQHHLQLRDALKLRPQDLFYRVHTTGESAKRLLRLNVVDGVEWDRPGVGRTSTAACVMASSRGGTTFHGGVTCKRITVGEVWQTVQL